MCKDTDAERALSPNPNSPLVIEVVLRQETPPEIREMQAPILLKADVPDVKGGLNIEALRTLLQQPSLLAASFPFGYLGQETDTSFLHLQLSEEELQERARFLTLYFPSDVDVEQTIKDLTQLPYVEQAMRVPRFMPPLQRDLNCAGFGQISGTQWYLQRCGITAAWDLGVSGKNTVIADVDWGFRVSHESLTTRTTKMLNAVDNSSNVSDDDDINEKHGTGVLGLAGAAGNASGFTGIAFAAELWAIKGSGAFSYEKWLKAIDLVRVTDSGGKRKIMLFEVQGGCEQDIECVPSICSALRQAIQDTIVTVVPAGNGGQVVRVASPTQSILVGATTKGNQRTVDSNYGCPVVICAPGDQFDDLTCCADSDNSYTKMFGGTSGAAAKVAGAIALMLEANSALTHHQVREILQRTGSPIVTDQPIGTFLDAKAAVDAARKGK